MAVLNKKFVRHSYTDHSGNRTPHFFFFFFFWGGGVKMHNMHLKSSQSRAANKLQIQARSPTMNVIIIIVHYYC